MDIKTLLKCIITKLLRFRRYGMRPAASTPAGCHRLADGVRPTFFGYHDKSPFNIDDTKILGMSIDGNDTDPEREGTPARIGYFEVQPEMRQSSEFTPVATTTAWCWQQGCMLQWYPASSNSQVIFNSIVGSEYGAEVWDLTKKLRLRVFNHPVYSLRRDGSLAATLNYSRLGRLRPGYGYGALPDRTLGVSAPADDGLFLMDMKTGSTQLAVSLESLARDMGASEAEHYVNHATFSPSGACLVFFHLWVDLHTRRRSLRACRLDLDSGRISTIESARTVSHYGWLDDANLIAVTHDRMDGWQLQGYNLVSGKVTRYAGMRGDGHPMVHPVAGNWLLMDTYPDRLRDQTLKIIDLEDMHCVGFLPFYSPMQYRGHVRCDLHPRWNRDGRKICVDSSCHGRRAMYILDAASMGAST